jgi:hypothetical protein
MTRKNSVTVPGSQVIYRTRAVGMGFGLWVVWSVILYWLLAQWNSALSVPAVVVLACWNLLLAYLALRSFFVRLEITANELLVRGWFRNRRFLREELQRIDHLRGPIPLAVAVSFGVRTIPQSWFLVLATRSEQSLALDSTLASYANSKLQLETLRAWLAAERSDLC